MRSSLKAAACLSLAAHAVLMGGSVSILRLKGRGDAARAAASSGAGLPAAATDSAVDVELSPAGQPEEGIAAGPSRRPRRVRHAARRAVVARVASSDARARAPEALRGDGAASGMSVTLRCDRTTGPDWQSLVGGLRENLERDVSAVAPEFEALLMVAPGANTRSVTVLTGRPRLSEAQVQAARGRTPANGAPAACYRHLIYRGRDRVGASEDALADVLRRLDGEPGLLPEGIDVAIRGLAGADGAAEVEVVLGADPDPFLDVSATFADDGDADRWEPAWRARHESDLRGLAENARFERVGRALHLRVNLTSAELGDVGPILPRLFR